MAINRATYYQAPPPDVSYKATPAYEYASIFLKNRANQWDLSLKQAAAEIADTAAQNKLLVDAYKRRQSDLQDSLDNVNKLITGVKQGDQKAMLAVAKLNEDIKNKNDAEALKWAQLKGEQVNVPFATSSGVSFSTGGGAGVVGGKIPSSVAADVDKFELANRGKDLSQLMPALAKETSSGGIIAKGTDVEQTNIRGQIASRAANVRAAELQLQGVSEAEAIGQARAEAIYELEKTDPVAASQVTKYFESTQTEPTTAGAGGGGGYSQRQAVSGAVQRPKYQLPSEMPQGAAGAVTVSPLSTAALEDEKSKIEEQLGQLKPPEMSDFDWITRGREIMAGRFGPVMPAPSFYQRNVAQQLQGATDEQIRQAYDLWKKSKPVAPPTEPTVPTSGGTPTYEQLPGLKTSLPTTAGATPAVPVATPDVTTTPLAPVSPAAPGAALLQPALSGADVIRAVEQKRAPYPIRQKELDALFPEGLPASVLAGIENIGKKPTPAPLTTPVQGPDVTGYRDRGSIHGGEPTFTPLPPLKTEKPAQETPGIGSKTFIPQSSWMPTPQPGGTVTFEPVGKGLETAPTLTPSVNQPSVMNYYKNRVLEAKDIAADPKSLQSVTKSGAGKVAADIYRANAATGQPFIKTYETITMTFAGDPDNMAKAHAAALALDMAANNKTAPPKE